MQETGNLSRQGRRRLWVLVGLGASPGMSPGADMRALDTWAGGRGAEAHEDCVPVSAHLGHTESEPWKCHGEIRASLRDESQEAAARDRLRVLVTYWTWGEGGCAPRLLVGRAEGVGGTIPGAASLANRSVLISWPAHGAAAAGVGGTEAGGAGGQEGCRSSAF